MKRLTGLVLAIAASALVGCGDNGVECGEGTMNEDGVCVPTGGPTVTCTDGTMLDTATNTCVIDPASCQAGTVLIDNACQDPTAGLTVDVTEAAEPNAIGVGGEESEFLAGEIVLKPVGGAAVVVQGNLKPRPDTDEDGSPEPDYDTYLIQVDGPTLLEVSVDGVGGVAGGFLALTGDNIDLIDWARFGINLLGDTSKRQLYLPTGGAYLFVVADTRTLVNSEAVGDATNKYFASIKQIAIPAAEAITVAAKVGTVQGTITDGAVKFYTAPMGAGFNTASLTTYNDDLRGSLIATTSTTAVKAVADENKSGQLDVPAAVTVGGFQGATPSATFVVDHVINSAGTAVDFRLDVKQGDAMAIPTTIGDATQDNPTDVGPTTLGGLALYYFDVNDANQIVGLDLAFNQLVDGMIVDDKGNIVSEFSYFALAAEVFGGFDAGFGWDAWQFYQGGFRVRAAGRYYLAVYSPALDAGEDLTLHGAVGSIALDTLTFGTPVTNVAIGAFNEKVYDYATGGNEWHDISLAPNAATGGAYFYLLDKSTAFGRLNDLVTDSDALGPDGGAILGAFADGADSVNQGFIKIGFPDTVFVAVSTIDNAGTFTLGSVARVYQNEGTQNAGANVTKTGETLTGGTKRYLVKVAAGSKVSVTADPAVTLDVGINALDYDEFVNDSVDDGLLDASETLDITAGANGYVAFEVADTGVVAGTGTFNLTYTVTAPVPPVLAYSVAAGTTTWANACNGGIDVTPTDRDDGTTAAITIPADFTFFSGAVTKVKINANGWLTLNEADTSTGSATYTPRRFPTSSAPNGVIAAYWTDTFNNRICTKTSGTKFIVQWRGTEYGTGDTIASQVILDSATDTIEFVYAPYTEGNGEGASGGLESGTGSQGVSVFFNEEDAVMPGTSKKLTPM